MQLRGEFCAVTAAIWGAIVFLSSSCIALPTAPNDGTLTSQNVANFASQTKSIAPNEFPNFEFEELEEAKPRTRRASGSDPALDGIVESIRTNLNQAITEELEGTSRAHRQHKKDTAEQTSNDHDNSIDDNNIIHPAGHVHKINSPQDIMHHHMLHPGHANEHHEKTVETEQERLEVNESLGFRILEFFGTIAGLAWGIITNITRLFAGSATTASGSSSSSSSS